MNCTFSINETSRRSPDRTLPLGFFAISHLWIKEKNRRLITGKWFCIESDNSKIFRVLRFSPKLEANKDDSKGQISIDYDAWNQLAGFSEDSSQPLSLRFRRASKMEFIRCISSHPDPSYRIAGWLGVISVILGFIGFALGVVSICK